MAGIRPLPTANGDDMPRTADTAPGTTGGIPPAKRAIMAKAARLFADKGYGSVGISEVGEVAGLGKGALYYHIGSKEELLYSIMTDYMQQLNNAANAILDEVSDTRERIEKLSASFMSTMFKSRAAMTVCFREVHSLGLEKRDRVMQLHADYQRIWERTYADGVARGECREVSRLETKALLGMYFYAFLWVRLEGPATSDQIARDFADIVLAAVALPPKR